MDHSEEIVSWAESADRSLTASLLLGRGSARAIAKAHLSELHKLVEGDRDVALTEISKVKNFGSRRLLMESFRQTFSLINEHPKYHILLEDVDFNDKTVARQYDQALLELFRECGNNKNLLTAKLAHYPVKKRKIALKRLEHPDFQKSRRIKLNQNLFYGLTDSELERGPLSWWQWLAVLLMISLFVFIFTS